MQTSSDIFADYFQNAQEMFFVADQNGRMLAVNPYGAMLLGYDAPDELLAIDSLFDLYYYPQDRRAFQDRLAREGFVRNYEITLKKKNGSKIPVSLTGKAVIEGGKVFRYEGIIRDFSRTKEMEKQLLHLERLAAMGKLSAEIAHEINNPLGGILMYAKLALEDVDRGEVVDRPLEKIVKLATRCSMIVRGLLDFGRNEVAERQLVDLNRVILDMFDLVRDHILFRHTRVEMKLGENLPLVWGERSNFEQVALNMMINAAEAMEGEGILSIETGYDESNSMFMIQFKDTGPGISQENLNRIFEPFFTTKKRGKGTGLGLSITHGVIQKHGGSISINSTPSEGTIFVIHLPANSGSYDFSRKNLSN